MSSVKRYKNLIGAILQYSFYSKKAQSILSEISKNMTISDMNLVIDCNESDLRNAVSDLVMDDRFSIVNDEFFGEVLRYKETIKAEFSFSIGSDSLENVTIDLIADFINTGALK